ncbi:MAG: protein kinase [Deltaproteobacteria bacterium]|jgi:tetratricopeptide (TPR) repeat protein|nr:protein kinase [Deltaproteobacteria bacterium]MBW2530855.1 protein kinase [Deltaproteobacteria bacterium]
MEAGEVVSDRFEIERIAGSGGMGTVYRAIDRHTGSAVALKTLQTSDEEHAKRFNLEAKVLYDLHHPRIVRYIAHGRTPAGQLYLVMEWLEGESLSQRLKRVPLALDDCITLGTRVAEAIAYAHQRGVVHRDLKPGNLLLVDREINRLKLLDFGLARLSAGGAALTRTGAMLGTPGYMAPEQARGEKTIDTRTDVFALGCVLFRCITGRTVFRGDDLLAVLAKLVLEDAPRLSEFRPDIPPDLDELMARMLARNPEERPTDGATVLAALESLGTMMDESDMRPAISPSIAPLSITTTERRVMCAVLAKVTGMLADDDATLIAGQLTHSIDAVRLAVRPIGGEVQKLLDGSLLVTVGSGSPSEQAARAARCALIMRGELKRAPIALVAGRGVRNEAGVPLGDAIDRAIALLSSGAGEEIRLDPVAAALMGDHYEVARDELGLYLRGGRGGTDGAVVTLLGKSTPFVGRAREMRNLEATFEECVDEPVARAVLVTGRPGSGKSRLRYEFLRRLKARGTVIDDEGEERSFAIWMSRGDPMSVGAAFGMLKPLVQQAIGARGGESVELGRKLLQKRLESRAADADRARIAEFLGELIGTPFEEEHSVQLRVARDDPMVMGDQMLRAFEDWLAAECETQPVLLVLEDLHLGDLPTVRFIESALRNLADSPLLVLALARPDVHDQFPKLWHERDLQEVRLGPLTKKASTKLVRHVLGNELAQEVVERVVEQAGGNAFFLEELIRAVSEGRGDQLPDTVLAMIQARLDALEPEGRRLLRAASVFGQVFWRGGVLTLMGDESAPSDIGDWLEELVRLELIIRRPGSKFPGEEEYTFRNAVVREAAYTMLTQEDRELGHRLARTWLEEIGEREAVVLAEHLERGGEPQHAVQWYLKAAIQALEGNDLEAAIERAERGVVCGAVQEELGSLRLLQAGANRWRGEFEAMRESGKAAMAELDQGSARWCTAAAEVGVACRALGKKEDLCEVANQLLRLSPTPDVVPAYAKASARVAMQLFLVGESELGDELLQRIPALSSVAALAERDPTAVAWIHHARAFEALYAGDPGGYLDHSAAAARGFEQAGDLRSVCNCSVHLGFAYNEVGAYQQAEQALRDALAGAERMGLYNVVATAKNNLGIALARLGKLEEAHAVETEAILDSAKQNDRRMEGGSRHYLATILELQGELEEAEREAQRSAELLLVAPPLRAHVLATVARIRLRLGRAGEALATSREAMGELEKLGGLEEGEAAVRLVHARALSESGLDEEAKKAIDEAKARLLARAEKIQDEGWRESFLANVPENARTLELATDAEGTS